MTTPAASKTVVFRRPFTLSGFEQLRAAGAYAIETEEELIEALSFPVWKRISTIMRSSGLDASAQLHIAPNELREAFSDAVHGISSDKSSSG